MLAQVTNQAADTVVKAQAQISGNRIADLDAHTLALLGVGIAIVFLYFIVFRFMKMIESRLPAIPVPTGNKKVSVTTESERKVSSGSAPNSETFAAIATALHLYKNELHDHEQTVLTINRVGKMYTPWSSKIYGLRNNPR